MSDCNISAVRQVSGGWCGISQQLMAHVVPTNRQRQGASAYRPYLGLDRDRFHVY
jgi:hypothetical protein